MAVSIRIECEQVFNDANGLWIYAKKGEEIPNGKHLVINAYVCHKRDSLYRATLLYA